MEVNNGIIFMDGKNGSQELLASVSENTDFVNTWILMGSPLPVTMILASYLLFVLKVGPAIMKNREPFKLHSIMPLYNAVQVLISCFLLYVCVKMLSENGLVPKTCVMETDYNRRSITAAMYYYLLAKFSELLDTVFFVLRKKYNQVSFLHVYHHTLMVVVTWIALKYEPTYALLFLGMLNSFVHVVMYTYYGLSSFPNLAKYLWWKKYITSLQLVVPITIIGCILSFDKAMTTKFAKENNMLPTYKIQFVLILTHFGVACVKSDCKPSYIMSVAMAINIFLFLYLFGSFYVRTYNKKSIAKAESNKKITLANGTKVNVSENDTKMYQNGKKVPNGNNSNESNCKSASITVNDTFRIRFNLTSNKLT